MGVGAKDGTMSGSPGKGTAIITREVAGRLREWSPVPFAAAGRVVGVPYESKAVRSGQIIHYSLCRGRWTGGLEPQFLGIIQRRGRQYLAISGDKFDIPYLQSWLQIARRLVHFCLFLHYWNSVQYQWTNDLCTPLRFVKDQNIITYEHGTKHTWSKIQYCQTCSNKWFSTGYRQKDNHVKSLFRKEADKAYPYVVIRSNSLQRYRWDIPAVYCTGGKKQTRQKATTHHMNIYGMMEEPFRIDNVRQQHLGPPLNSSIRIWNYSCTPRRIPALSYTTTTTKPFIPK
jgi:hypothetical protein